MLSAELLRHFGPAMLTALISRQGGCVGAAEGRAGCWVLGVPRAGRTGTGRRGLSTAVAEAALKFPDAFELLVKSLEIGGVTDYPSGKSS